MPSNWVDAIELECIKRGLDRSEFVREALKVYFPILADDKKLNEYLANNES